MSSDDSIRKNSVQVRLSLRNHGKTPVIVTSVIGGVKRGRTAPDLTKLPQLTGAAGRVISSDEFPSLDPLITWIPSDEYEVAKASGEPVMYFVGRIDYLDVLKISRWTKFQFKFDFGQRRFEPFSDPAGGDWT